MDEEERRDLVQRLFAVATALLEDAAGLAAEAQGEGESARSISLAHRIAELSGQARTVAEAAAALGQE